MHYSMTRAAMKSEVGATIELYSNAVCFSSLFSSSFRLVMAGLGGQDAATCIVNPLLSIVLVLALIPVWHFQTTCRNNIKLS